MKHSTSGTHASPAKEQQMGTTTLVHMSDLHIAATADELYMGQDTMATLRSCLDRAFRANLLPRCPLVFSGDLSNHGEPESYERLRDLVDELTAAGVQVLLGIGNHDNRRNFNTVCRGLDGEQAAQPYYYSRMLGGLRLVMLDPHLPDSPEGEIDSAQLAWLEAELAQPAPDGTVVVIHHPPVSQKLHALPFLMVRNDAQLGAVLAGKDVVAILSGHIHFPLTSSLNGIPVAAAPGTAHLLDPWATDALIMQAGCGFNVVTVRDGVLEVVSTILPGRQEEIGRISLQELGEHIERMKVQAALAG
jgi:3',5'-cyclic AMP phosphodiesterase CpdA